MADIVRIDLTDVENTLQGAITPPFQLTDYSDGGTIELAAGRTEEIGGILYRVEDGDLAITDSGVANGEVFIHVKEDGDGTASVYLSVEPGTFDPNLGGYYHTDGAKVLFRMIKAAGPVYNERMHILQRPNLIVKGDLKVDGIIRDTFLGPLYFPSAGVSSQVFPDAADDDPDLDGVTYRQRQFVPLGIKEGNGTNNTQTYAKFVGFLCNFNGEVSIAASIRRVDASDAVQIGWSIDGGSITSWAVLTPTTNVYERVQPQQFSPVAVTSGQIFEVWFRHGNSPAAEVNIANLVLVSQTVPGNYVEEDV